MEPEAVAADYGGVVCSADGGALGPVTRFVGKGRHGHARVGWRCEKCGAGFTNGFSRDHSLDRKRWRR